jgi:hypothetical protein
MELFGPNSWLTGFYLGALKAAAEMAAALGENETAVEYGAIYERGRAWVDKNLFNGEYFVQKIDLGDKSVLQPFTATEKAAGVLGDGVESLYWSAEHKELKYQLGEGVLIDQVLGQWHAGLYGLGDVLDAKKTVSALKAVYRYNFIPELGDIYNPCRVFGLYDEAGTIIANWPEGKRKPAVPVPYAQETMHGMEYAFSQMLMRYGMLEEGTRVAKGVRDRYDGAKRNPWNEIECGSNYARSMASWGAMIVLSGFTYDATRGYIGFDPMVREGDAFVSFWSGGNAYGTVELHKGQLKVSVMGGGLDLSSLGLPKGSGAVKGAALNRRALPFRAADGVVRFDAARLNAGDILEISAPTLAVADLADINTL